jgi:hypothetical protein
MDSSQVSNLLKDPSSESCALGNVSDIVENAGDQKRVDHRTVTLKEALEERTETVDESEQSVEELELPKENLNLSFDSNIFEDSFLSHTEDSSLQLEKSPGKTVKHDDIEESIESESLKTKMPSNLRSVNCLGIYFHEKCLAHDIPRHPEQPLRAQFIYDNLYEHFKDNPDVTFREATQIKDEQILLYHSRRLLEAFEKKWRETEKMFKSTGKIIYREIDGDTQIMHETKDAAYYAAGSVINAIDHVYLPKKHSQAIDTAFCCVRPPGHHAEPNRAMGFCFFNNVAIGAVYARDKYGIKRVAVLDFDVHHGNGNCFLLSFLLFLTFPYFSLFYPW